MCFQRSSYPNLQTLSECTEDEHDDNNNKQDEIHPQELQPKRLISLSNSVSGKPNFFISRLFGES